ncbi:MAG: hypothetical protein Q9212_003871 [Teloschistes hypoglaucus]
MLFDFHKQENSKKPGSIHAVYLVCGFVSAAPSAPPTQLEQKDGEYVSMQSSPFMTSSMPQKEEDDELTTAKTVVLCREEDLEGSPFVACTEVKARFVGQTSIHVYSLGPSTIKNLHILSECNRATTADYAKEDPLIVGRQYGTIVNPKVKRRTVPKPLPTSSTAAAVGGNTKGKSADPPTKKEAPSTKTQEGPEIQRKTSSQAESKPKEPTAKPSSQERKGVGKTPGLKREQSDIFKSFAKTPAKVSRMNTDSSAGASPASEVVPIWNLTSNDQESASATKAPAHKDDGSITPLFKELFSDQTSIADPMGYSSEEEQPDAFPPSKEQATKTSRPLRSEREAQLRKMMDDEDDAPEESKESEPNHENQESSGTVLGDKQEEAKQEEAEQEKPPTVSGGRRRGRRKIMKKVMLRDEEGYLVTKEEPAWESFSEDEPPPKEKTLTSTPSSTSTKGVKSTAKKGQGNLMSFFGKK